MPATRMSCSELSICTVGRGTLGTEALAWAGPFASPSASLCSLMLGRVSLALGTVDTSVCARRPVRQAILAYHLEKMESNIRRNNDMS